MMNCDKALSLLSDYIDGTLDPEIRREVETHLNNDPACMAVFKDAQKIRLQFGKMEPVKTSADFDANLRKRIMDFNAGTEKSILNGKKGLSLAFSGTTLVVVFAVMMFSDYGSGPRPEQENIQPSSTIEIKTNKNADRELVKEEAINDSLKKPDEINTENIKTASEKR